MADQYMDESASITDIIEVIKKSHKPSLIQGLFAQSRKLGTKKSPEEEKSLPLNYKPPLPSSTSCKNENLTVGNTSLTRSTSTPDFGHKFQTTRDNYLKPNREAKKSLFPCGSSNIRTNNIFQSEDFQKLKYGVTPSSSTSKLSTNFKGADSFTLYNKENYDHGRDKKDCVVTSDSCSKKPMLPSMNKKYSITAHSSKPSSLSKGWQRPVPLSTPVNKKIEQFTAPDSPDSPVLKSSVRKLSSQTKDSCSKIDQNRTQENVFQVKRPNTQNIPKFSLETPSKESLSHTQPSKFQTPTVKTTPAPNLMNSLSKHNVKEMIINGQEYINLEVLGKGGSSTVYKVLDMESKAVKAVKVVDLNAVDEDGLVGLKNEIEILMRLSWSSRIIKIYDHEERDGQLYLVMELGSQDLDMILKDARGKNKDPIPSYTIKHYWEGMLNAVQVIHQEGIIHLDLKPANFLLVNQHIKLIDFGIASSIQQDMTSVLKENPAGTINYMSPESLNDVYTGPIINGKRGDNKPVIKVGVKSDVWSLGCILYNLVYGKTPFKDITNPMMKFHAISNPKTEISFPDIPDKHLLDVMKCCLQFDPKKRPSIGELLKHPYLNEEAKSAEKDLKSKIQELTQLTPNRMEKLMQSIQKEIHP